MSLKLRKATQKVKIPNKESRRKSINKEKEKATKEDIRNKVQKINMLIEM
jgi:hypothetical protein